MIHIKTIKLFNGDKRYAVVEPFTSTIVVKEPSKIEGEKAKTRTISKTEYLPVEYTVGKGVTAQILPAIFPVTDEGLKQAKEIQALFKNAKNSKKSSK